MTRLTLSSAALWLGALAALTILLLRRTAPDDPAIHGALRGFAGLGTLAVVLLVLTGEVSVHTTDAGTHEPVVISVLGPGRRAAASRDWSWSSMGVSWVVGYVKNDR